MRVGTINTAVIASGAKLSGEVDMGGYYEKVLVIVPDLTTDSSVSIQVSPSSGGTFTTLQSGGSGVAVNKSAAQVVEIGGAPFLKIACATNQGADRTIYLIGI
jgi:hypothetical protein